MGIWSAISSGISSFVSSVGSFISNTIGPAIANFAKAAVSIVAKLPIPGISDIARVIDVVVKVAQVVIAVVKALGVETEDDPTVLGAKAAQCEEKPEDFESTEAYIKHLKENVQLDKEKVDKMSREEKLGCTAIGMALGTQVIEEKVGGILIPADCVGVIATLQAGGVTIDPKGVLDVIKALKEAGITDMGAVVEYLEGTGDGDRIKTGEAIEKALGEGAIERIENILRNGVEE